MRIPECGMTMFGYVIANVTKPIAEPGWSDAKKLNVRHAKENEHAQGSTGD
jgi:hypothetical protein